MEPTYLETLISLATAPHTVFSFLLVGAVFWSLIFSVYFALKLHTSTNGRQFTKDMEKMSDDPKALATYYGMRLLAYALLAAACVFAAP